MAGSVLSDEPNIRQRARVLLSVADCVKREGWGDAVAAQLRQAARDLLGMAAAGNEAVTAKGVARPPDPWRTADPSSGTDR
jgi:hypothetical protein